MLMILIDDHFWWQKQAENMRKQPYLAGLSENMQKNTKNAKNAISPNSFGRKLKNGLSYIGTFRIQELANGDLGLQKKI